MGGRVRSAALLGLEVTTSFVQNTMEQSTSCRECDQRVSFFERYCPTCGQFAPVRLTPKVGLLVFGLPIFLVSVYLGVKHGL